MRGGAAQIGIEKVERRGADCLMDRGTIDAWRIDAGLGEFVPPLLVAFIDEDLVIHVRG